MKVFCEAINLKVVIAVLDRFDTNLPVLVLPSVHCQLDNLQALRLHSRRMTKLPQL